jgi:hypothetical protein
MKSEESDDELLHSNIPPIDDKKTRERSSNEKPWWLNIIKTKL